jgi:hypothetical protein
MTQNSTSAVALVSNLLNEHLINGRISPFSLLFPIKKVYNIPKLRVYIKLSIVYYNKKEAIKKRSKRDKNANEYSYRRESWPRT